MNHPILLAARIKKSEVVECVQFANAANATHCRLGGVDYPAQSIRYCEFLPDTYEPETQTFVGHLAFDRKVAQATTSKDFTWLGEKINAVP